MLLLNIIIEEHNAIELLNGAREGFEHQPNFFIFQKRSVLFRVQKTTWCSCRDSNPGRRDENPQ